MSRLNVQYTVLSKRRLIKLVDKNYVRGWDDPRMPTVSGLRRRGYTADIINQFCNDVGATRAMNVVEMSKLQQTARTMLSPVSRRAMLALQPILVSITNFQEANGGSDTMTFTVQNSPTDESLGSHSITMRPQIYIDSSDFRLEDSPQYYGLAPNKPIGVGLKYHGGTILCDEVVFDSQDKSKIKELKCHFDTTPNPPKPKTYISWVPSDALKCEVRVYSHLFVVPEPTDTWEDELNPDSEIVYSDALVDPSIKDVVDGSKIDKWTSQAPFQFERVGYFVVDYDTTYNPNTGDGIIVFNQTVSLKEEVFKKKLSADEEAAIAARKDKVKRDLEAKEIRMQIDPKDLFKEGEEFKGKYSKYNEDTGIPTHDIDGTEITKSMMKKLAKEQQKHIKQVTKWNQNKEKK